MSYIDEKAHVTKKQLNKKTIILTCMDGRLIKLLPSALNLKEEDVEIVTSAGAICSDPFGSVMRSILIAVYLSEAEDIVVVGHHDCEMQGMDSSAFIDKMKRRGLKSEVIPTFCCCGIDIDEVFKGFNNTQSSIINTVELIKNHPFIPKDVSVSGFIIELKTGELEKITD